MSKNESLKTWGIIIALLILSGVATATWQWASARTTTAREHVAVPRSEPPVLEIRLRDYVVGDLLAETPVIQDLDGRQFNQFEALGILIALTLVPLIALALPIAFIFMRLDKQTATVKETETFKTAATQLSKREDAEVKQIRQAQPAKPRRPDPTMPRWSVISTSLIVVLFVMFLGFMLGRATLPHESLMGHTIVDPAVMLMWASGLVTAVVLFFVLRGKARALAASDDGDYSPPPWGWIWVIITGLLIVGLGTGLSLILRNMPSG